MALEIFFLLSIYDVRDILVFPCLHISLVPGFTSLLYLDLSLSSGESLVANVCLTIVYQVVGVGSKGLCDPYVSAYNTFFTSFLLPLLFSIFW